jgi:APA family basic amino acid/polyamine antiporter
MAPVAGSAYTYAYATLGELLAWIIGWDLVLEYAMSGGVVAGEWTKYLNELLVVVFDWQIPERFSSDPFTNSNALFNLPAVLIMILVTTVLVIGIRESAATNTLLVAIKVGVVLFVIGAGMFYVDPANWTTIPVEQRIVTDTGEFLRRNPQLATLVPENERDHLNGSDLLEKYPAVAERLDDKTIEEVKGFRSPAGAWGLLGTLGVHRWLSPLDERTRTPFMPYGLSGVMVAAAAVFFAYIGFDSISTHAEEARNPQRDVPIGILASLGICTLLYFGVSAVITGMEPYPTIDRHAAIAAAFRKLAVQEQSIWLRISAFLIATGALAGMTSVLLITFLSQARIFLAMARDGLLPPGIFAAIHPRFRTPHVSTMLTGGLMTVVTAVTPIGVLFEMVNIGTLLAFAIVCASVWLLRVKRPDAERPFRCPFIHVLAPLGIVVNVIMMLFLPWQTWVRLVGWLALGLVIYFSYGWRHSVAGKRLAAGEPT